MESPRQCIAFRVDTIMNQSVGAKVGGSRRYYERDSLQQRDTTTQYFLSTSQKSHIHFGYDHEI